MSVRPLGNIIDPLRVDRAVQLDLHVAVRGVEVDALERFLERLDRVTRRIRARLVDKAGAVGVRADDLPRVVLRRHFHDLLVHAADIANARDTARDVQDAVRKGEVAVHVPESRDQRFAFAVDVFGPEYVDLYVGDARDLAVLDHDELVLEQDPVFDIDNIHVVEHERTVQFVREVAGDALDHCGILLDLDCAQLREDVRAPASWEHAHVAAEIENCELQIVIKPSV